MQMTQSEQHKTERNRKKEIRNYFFSCPPRASQIRLLLNWWVNCRSETWLWGILPFIASLHSNLTCWSAASVCVCVCVWFSQELRFSHSPSVIRETTSPHHSHASENQHIDAKVMQKHRTSPAHMPGQMRDGSLITETSDSLRFLPEESMMSPRML